MPPFLILLIIGFSLLSLTCTIVLIAASMLARSTPCLHAPVKRKYLTPASPEQTPPHEHSTIGI